MSATTSHTLLDRLRSRTKLSPLGLIVICGLALTLLPILVVWLEGYWQEVFQQRYWRALFVAPVIVVYILILEQVFKRMEANVIQGLKKVVRLSETDFRELVISTMAVNARSEWLAFLLGVSFGLIAVFQESVLEGFSWISLYLGLANCLMYGLIGWVIYSSITGARLLTSLYRQPLDIDIFDLRPFEPIGRQSLAISLAFIGGITLSLLFSDIGSGILTLQFWIVYAVMIIMAVVVFFLNMIPTHRVLAGVKDADMDLVEQNLRAAYQKMMVLKPGEAGSQAAAQELNAWKTCQDLLEDAKTWPYTIETLRNLMFTGLIPGAAAIIRLLVEVYFD
jgi:hypothetical protein